MTMLRLTLRAGGPLLLAGLLLCAGTMGLGAALPLWDLLAFTQVVNGQSDVFLADSTGRTVNLTRTRYASELHPTWSPDGERLAYISDATRNHELYIMRPFSGEVQQITDTNNPHANPSWSPDGRQIAVAFISNMVVNQLDVFTIDLQTGERRNLTEPGEGSTIIQGTAPQWSPNGEYVLFINQSRLMIHVVRLPYGEPVAQTRPGRIDPAWSPDGTRLVYVGPRDNFNSSVNDTLYVARIDSDSSPRAYITDMRYVQSPVWSPDGKTIAFVAEPINMPLTPSRFAQHRMDVFLLDVASGDITRLTKVAGTFTSVAWSPDGDQLLFRYDDPTALTTYLCIRHVHNQHQRCIAGIAARHVTWQPRL